MTLTNELGFWKLSGVRAVICAQPTSGGDLSRAGMRRADLSHLDVDRDLELIELIGVQLEGARS